MLEFRTDLAMENLASDLSYPGVEVHRWQESDIELIEVVILTQEAAQALGVSYPRMMWDIVFPQAIKSVLPSIINEVINLLKGTSLVATIGMVEIMRTAQLVMNATYRSFEPFLVAALIYYVIVTILNFIAKCIERKVRKSDQR